MVCPVALVPSDAQAAGAMAALYQLAYQQARDAVLPPWHDRQFMASIN
jgi:hypothetical protein